MAIISSRDLTAFIASGILAIGILASTASGHGIEVRSCRTPDGKFKFFVETWHSWYGDVDNNGFGTMTMDVLKYTNDGTVLQDDTQTEAPDSLILGQNIYHPDRTTGNSNPWLDDNVWGCINGAQPSLINLPGNPTYSGTTIYDRYSETTPDSDNAAFVAFGSDATDWCPNNPNANTLVAHENGDVLTHTCHHFLGGPTNGQPQCTSGCGGQMRHNWATYTREAQCNVNIQFTLKTGDTVVLRDGCGATPINSANPNGALYPAVVGPAVFLDESAPVPQVNGQALPYVLEVEAATLASTSATASFTISAADDCDTSPSAVLVSGPASGSVFPLGDTLVTIRAEDNQGNSAEGVLTVRVALPPDSDADGLSDADENASNPYITDPHLQDTDGDGLSDYYEIHQGLDPTNPDSDGDALEDGEEVNDYDTDPLVADTDGDGLEDGDEVNTHGTNPLVNDTDGDGLSDYVEVVDCEGCNATLQDTDNEGLTDKEEYIDHDTNPANQDTDGDGLNDYDEVNDHNTNPNLADSDGDGLTDGAEVNTHGTNPLEADTDGDGLSDGDEVNTHGTNPLVNDTDGDGLSDYVEVVDCEGCNATLQDTDNEGLTDKEEYIDHDTNPANQDTDGDGLNDYDEVNDHNTNPNLADSDGDGLTDGAEVNTHGTNPLEADTDGDGLSDGDEVNTHGTNPLEADTDGDGLTDDVEVLECAGCCAGCDPTLYDTDNDGLNDKQEHIDHNTDPAKQDSDEDGLTDYEEVMTYLTLPNDANTDGDCMDDGYEVLTAKTDPLKVDSDGDGVGDCEEIDIGTDPMAFPPTTSPSESPTSKPTVSPTESPSANPTESPTSEPTPKPTGAPSTSPTPKPTSEPSSSPTGAPSESPTPAPTNFPTVSPTTAEPTPSPSDYPSSAPSSVDQTVTTPGALSFNQDICTYSNSARDSFVAKTLETIQEIADCPEGTECVAEITDVCGGGRRLSQERGLQETAWQIRYQITREFTCEYATCGAPSDTATTDSIVNNIKNDVLGSLDSDEFLTILSNNIFNDPGTLDTSITVCLAVWGVVDEPALVVVPDEGTDIYYPDWEGHTGTCLNDGNQPLYMRLNNSTWLHSSLEECCDRYYGGWNKNKCMNLQGSGLWFVDYVSNKCVTDCEVGNGKTCGGLANPVSNELYAAPLECCQNKIPWLLDSFCESESLISSCYGGTGKYYRGDTADVEVCVRDCSTETADASCGGIVEDNHIMLYDTAEDCCTNQYGWIDVELCAIRSTVTTEVKYWPDMVGGKCVDDSETPAEDLSVELYDSISECCTSEIQWLTEDECTLASNSTAVGSVGSGKYYVKWSDEECAKDCEGPGCGGIAGDWQVLYDTASECCGRMPWADASDCITSAERDLRNII